MLQEPMNAGLESEIIDVRDCRLEATDNTETEPQALRFAQKVLSADALIIVAPEYNRGYPGELKVMLDMIYWRRRCTSPVWRRFFPRTERSRRASVKGTLRGKRDGQKLNGS